VKGLRAVAIAVSIWGIYANVVGFAGFPGGVPPHGTIDYVVKRDTEFQRIRWALHDAGYHEGYIGYVSPRTLRGEPRGGPDEMNWVMYRFAAIPHILTDSVPDPPFVIGDFTEDGKIPPTPEGLELVANPGSGLVLYKRLAKR
jgi:hypothetical protein